jgi:RNA polymerase sigma-70 factor (ECF subfamily)
MNPEDPDSARWFSSEVQVHERALRSWLRRRFPSLGDPENIVQEALTRVWRAGAGGTVTSPKGLLFTTARNLALDQLRHGSIISIESLTEDGDPAVFSDEPTAAEAAEQSQELQLLTQAIQSLPFRCRRVLTLRKIYGLSQREAAAELGISEHTVERQVAIGVRRCARFLAKYGLP